MLIPADTRIGASHGDRTQACCQGARDPTGSRKRQIGSMDADNP
jgi:hypothetical protein